MRTRMLITLIAVAAMLAPASTVGQSAAVAGVVLEGETTRPLEGVLVTAVSFEHTQQTKTDSEGRFTISGLQAGRYHLTPALDGWVYARPKQLQRPREPGIEVEVPMQGQKQVELRMVRESVITGRVVDLTGSPFPASRGKVSVFLKGYDERGRRKLVEAPMVHAGPAGAYGRMDDQGRYRLYGLQAGEYYISMSGGGVTQFYPGTSSDDVLLEASLKDWCALRMGNSFPALLWPLFLMLHCGMPGCCTDREPPISTESINCVVWPPVPTRYLPGRNSKAQLTVMRNSCSVSTQLAHLCGSIKPAWFRPM